MLKNAVSQFKEILKGIIWKWGLGSGEILTQKKKKKKPVKAISEEFSFCSLNGHATTIFFKYIQLTRDKQQYICVHACICAYIYAHMYMHIYK